MARLSARRPRHRGAGAILALVALVAVGFLGRGASPAAAVDRTDVKILVGEPSTFDPAAQSDSNTAAITAQIYETLTSYDVALQLQPALASSWDVASDGRSVVFHLRPDLAFSDGSSLTAEDVVGSWLRVIDPDRPSPLAALLLDVQGARAYLAGQSSDPSTVGLTASGLDVQVQLERPGADFPAIISAPLFAVVPPTVWRDGQDAFGPGAVVSGGYVIKAVTADEITLEANARYWAGAPAISTVHLVLDIGGRSPVAAFEAGDLDYTEISLADAPWIPYDRELGPQLRQTPSLALTYLGLDTTTKPFDDLRVRQALGAAVDWERVVGLSAFGGQEVARSMVPPAIPGGGDGSWLPVHDPEHARELLAAAGFPNGAGLPPITLAAGSAGIADGIKADLERELGMQVELVVLDDHLGRITDDPPNLWLTGWIADYVGPNDFLGVLLETGSANNDAGWSNAAFDAAIAEALATRDPAASEAAFERALAKIQDEVPVVPLYLSTDWALSRDGLQGAWGNGLGILRMAGMQWAP
ncbi:MAG TPA: peptide ABC transporter substrate-binding protein [Candidatus Limnocylindria bacterium]|nr:peptide ABC transporter substrate-binding protein [Candidatus Limnocylindria bacterium]